MTDTFVELRTNPNRVIFGGRFEIEDDFLYECFKAVPAAEYDDAFKKFLVVGAYAWREDRLQTFFRKVEDEVEGRLEELKVLYKVRTLRDKATTKGAEVERSAHEALQDFIDERNWGDEVALTGESVGKLARRKVGDLVVEIAGSERRVVIESKMDAKVPVGDPTELDGAGKVNHTPEKTAYGQNLTAIVNREADAAIIIFDRNNASPTVRGIGGAELGLRFNPELPAFIALIDPARDDWSNLFLAYSLARSLALLGEGTLEVKRVELIVKRIIRDLDRLVKIDHQLRNAEKAANDTLNALKTVREVTEALAESSERSLNALRRLSNGEVLSPEALKQFFDEVD
jgi:hypothetical protein